MTYAIVWDQELWDEWYENAIANRPGKGDLMDDEPVVPYKVLVHAMSHVHLSDWPSSVKHDSEVLLSEAIIEASPHPVEWRFPKDEA